MDPQDERMDGMIEASQLRQGMVVNIDNALYECVEQQLIKMGRGGATVKAKIRNLDTGAQFEPRSTRTSGYQNIPARRPARTVPLQRRQPPRARFMDVETYEQPVVPKEQIGDAEPWLIENMELQIAMHEGKAIRIELPTTVDIEVVEGATRLQGRYVVGRHEARQAGERRDGQRAVLRRDRLRAADRHPHRRLRHAGQGAVKHRTRPHGRSTP
ncbi:MAG: hypothetical protein U0470_08375 [Anaerolineae bacterium]